MNIGINVSDISIIYWYQCFLSQSQLRSVGSA